MFARTFTSDNYSLLSEYTESYRYGFNGKEKDDENSGNGNSIHFEFREFDPRICRFKSIDFQSSEYAWQSPYAYHRNNPVNLVDHLGLGDKPQEPKRESVAVKKGDNLWNIAKHMLGSGASNQSIHQKVNELMKINNLTTRSVLRIGQTIFTESETNFSKRKEQYIKDLRSYFDEFPKPKSNPRLVNQPIAGSHIDNQGNFFFNVDSYNELVDANLSGAEVANIEGGMLNALMTQIHWFNQDDNNSFYGSVVRKFVESGNSYYFDEGLVRFGPVSKISAYIKGGTFIMRNAFAKVWVSYNSNGTIKMEVKVYDTFNVTPQDDKDANYNRWAKPLNWLHKASGANPNMQTRATWTIGEK